MSNADNRRKPMPKPMPKPTPRPAAKPAAKQMPTKRSDVKPRPATGVAPKKPANATPTELRNAKINAMKKMASSSSSGKLAGGIKGASKKADIGKVAGDVGKNVGKVVGDVGKNVGKFFDDTVGKTVRDTQKNVNKFYKDRDAYIEERKNSNGVTDYDY